MPGFGTRLKYAFKAFFSILTKGRLPDGVLAALGPDTPSVEPVAESTPADLPDRAAQILAILQRDGRLIDFLMEDIGPYVDGQVGAAARDVHSGCRQALLRYVTLAPVMDGEEGGAVVVGPDMQASMVKVVGNVAGAPPFRGVLRHRGWQIIRFEPPPLPQEHRLVIAPAEVEVP